MGWVATSLLLQALLVAAQAVSHVPATISLNILSWNIHWQCGSGECAHSHGAASTCTVVVNQTLFVAHKRRQLKGVKPVSPLAG
jgi:hypothetical protein